MKGKFTVKDIVFIGVFAAVIAVMSQLSIPTPWGIPITLQTFAVALTGFALGKWKGTMATFVYILIGLVGVPVYSNFGAGPAKLFGLTGGFIWGFLFLAFASGWVESLQMKWLSIFLSIAGLLICHGCGAVQFAIVSNRTFLEAFLLASAPYLVKDIISIVVAYGLAIPIRKAMRMTGAAEKKTVD